MEIRVAALRRREEEIWMASILFDGFWQGISDHLPQERKMGGDQPIGCSCVKEEEGTGQQRLLLLALDNKILRSFTIR
ncbi:hypothetical protein E2562_033669 [Oryza meyeriana var. granulata]|uniref:Uncharacterized protein n=1 Tax=Oryza meyeriana var. granulata TaxID=110450 RepID=A0A6G1C9F0_9ORYZ|nr:hypothetical protein E2562_033669 [Oryza meyeriana var. granulata]